MTSRKVRINSEQARDLLKNAIMVRRYKDLPTELKAKIALIRKTFGLVRPISQKEWEEGFCHDLHPDREVQLWLQMAVGYELYFERKEQTKEEGNKVMAVLLTCVSTDDLLEIYACHKDSGLSMEFVSEVCACYLSQRGMDVPTE